MELEASQLVAIEAEQLLEALLELLPEQQRVQPAWQGEPPVAHRLEMAVQSVRALLAELALLAVRRP